MAQLAAWNTGSVPVAVARQTLIDAALEVQRTHLGAWGALRTAANLPGVIAVPAAALGVARAVAPFSQGASEVIDAAGRAVCATAFRVVSAARRPNSRSLDAGLTNLVTARTTGAGAISWTATR